jgi:hypothetical protein
MKTAREQRQAWHRAIKMKFLIIVPLYMAIIEAEILPVYLYKSMILFSDLETVSLVGAGGCMC